MKKQYILFNLDDTLIHCNKYFNLAIDQLAEQMKLWFDGIAEEEIKQKHLEIDLASIKKYGLSSERFTQSFVETYQYFCKIKKRPEDTKEIDQVKKIGNSVFEMEVEPLPEMYKTLELLKKEGHELFLHTGGDEENQRRKINQLELAAFFENRIFISLHKDTDALENIIKDLKLNKENTWMVGNSLRTDILPGLEQGINVIYIPVKNDWKYNEIEINIKPKRAFATLDSLSKVPEFIHQHILQFA